MCAYIFNELRPINIGNHLVYMRVKHILTADKLYEKMSETERRQFYEKLLGVNIYEERQSNGQWIKSIVFKLPIIEHDMELSLDNDDSVETIVSLSRV